MGALLQDLRYALRYLLRSPGFAVTAVLTLALGIGANSAIFSVLNGVLLKPLPFEEPDRLMYFSTRFPTIGHDEFPLALSEFLDFQEDNQTFAQVAAWIVTSVNLSGADEPLRATAIQTTYEVFEVLKVRAALGRVLERGDDEPGKPDVIILSDGLWRRAFGADPRVLGRTIEFNGRAAEVIGVLPPGIDLLDAGVEVWLPLPIDRSDRRDRGEHHFSMIGRLAPGVSEAQAQADLALVLRRWGERSELFHRFAPDFHMLQFWPLSQKMTGAVRPALWMLLGAVGFVLLIACANVANLLLMRAETRRKEIAVRASLGAGRHRLLRQFLTEGMALSFIGGAVGLLASYWGLRLLLTAYPHSVPRSAEVGLDGWVVLFTLAVTLGTGFVFGLAPSFHLTDRSLIEALREAGQRTTAGSARHLLRRALVVAEVALAVVLVVGAGLMLRSLWNLLDVDAGFDREGVLTFNVLLPRASHPKSSETLLFFDRLVRQIEVLPGVESAAIARGLPPKRPVDAFDATFEDLPPPPPGEPRNIDFWQMISPDYFETLGIPLVDGRAFTTADSRTAPPVAIVNQTLARVFWPGQNPLGKRLRARGPFKFHTVVGVAKDVKQNGLDAAVGTEIYLPYPQTADNYPVLPRACSCWCVRACLRRSCSRRCGGRCARSSRRCRSTACARWRRWSASR
ncbi:MAG: ABC transporter permease [Thermoanaerobaculia bacterium]|nr:ABC transporter permease [Thermoanaerobaculia bacterium]